MIWVESECQWDPECIIEGANFSTSGKPRKVSNDVGQADDENRNEA